MIRFGFLIHIYRIQSVTRDQFPEKLAEGLPVAEALQPYDLPIYCEETPTCKFFLSFFSYKGNDKNL